MYALHNSFVNSVHVSCPRTACVPKAGSLSPVFSRGTRRRSQRMTLQPARASALDGMGAAIELRSRCLLLYIEPNLFIEPNDSCTSYVRR